MKPVAAALEAHPDWAETPVRERAAILERFAGLVEREADALTSEIVREVGKRRVDAADEVAWTALSARWYARHPPAEERAGEARVLRRPLGVVAAVTPWNVPLVTPAWKWLPALMAGNAVVWKPSERATGTASAAQRLLREAGLPAGVLTLAPGGPEVARALCAEPAVRGLHFTGSERAGRELAALVAPRRARCALELSGLNQALVFESADLDLAADCIVACATALAGQKCTATRRALVAEPVLEPLTRRLAERLESLRVGPPGDPATDVGPLIDAAAATRAEAALLGALDRGATLVARSGAPDGDALFAPALLRGLAADDPLRTDELFAPVLAIEPFSSPDEAWRLAGESGHGLSASVFASEPALLVAAPRRLAAGVVALNRRGDSVDLEAPFLGRGRSGNGVAEGGAYAYEAVTELQAVYG
jgi:alpha-ketoglutaric semialdehyde dehydrogenase